MGGKKKPTISQAEKALLRESQKQEGRKGRIKEMSRVEKKVSGVIPPNPKDENIIKEIRRMRFLTPYLLASRYNLRISVAKDFLEELHRQGVITQVSSSRYVKIYRPT
ncbi:hypothetical protein J7L27_02935 [Candidatus Bathyarchaeota archaeon]|nr:hypothetical protein [Candidatus Bathyarchaeota archaeon]